MSNKLVNNQPKTTSLDYKVDDLRKNNVTSLLDDGWNAKNSLTSTLQMKSANPGNYMKVNSVANFSTNDSDEMSVKNTIDVEMKMKMWCSDVKTNVKGGRWTKHINRKLCEWKYNWNNQERSIWVNPYMIQSGSMTWENWVHSVGSIVHWCPDFVSRLQVNHDPRDNGEDSSSWSFQANNRYSKGNLWADWVYNVNLANPLSVLRRVVRVGWNDVNYHLLANFEKVAGNGGNAFMDSAWVGAAWKGDGWSAGAKVKAFMDNRSPHAEAGLCKKVNSDVSVKLKLDNNLDWNFLTTWKMCSSSSSEWGFSGNMKEHKKGGLYGAPIKMGIKVKMNK